DVTLGRGRIVGPVHAGDADEGARELDDLVAVDAPEEVGERRGGPARGHSTRGGRTGSPRPDGSRGAPRRRCRSSVLPLPRGSPRTPPPIARAASRET